MHDKRTPFSLRAQMPFDGVVRGARAGLSFERYREQSRRLIHHEELFVLVQNPHVPFSRGPFRTLGRTGPIHPDNDAIADAKSSSCVRKGHLAAVDEHASALERLGRRSPRLQTIRGREEFVESCPDLE